MELPTIPFIRTPYGRLLIFFEQSYYFNPGDNYLVDCAVVWIIMFHDSSNECMLLSIVAIVPSYVGLDGVDPTKGYRTNWTLTIRVYGEDLDIERSNIRNSLHRLYASPNIILRVLISSVDRISEEKVLALTLNCSLEAVKDAHHELFWITDQRIWVETRIPVRDTTH